MNMALSVAQRQENENYLKLRNVPLQTPFVFQTAKTPQVVEFIGRVVPENQNSGEMVSNLCSQAHVQY
jgi:hypothetical protein